MATEPTPHTPTTVMRRWLYAVGGLVVVLAVVVVVLLTTDDSASKQAADTTTTTEASTTTTGAPGTTAPPVTSTTVPLPPLTNDPQSYAQYLFAAWQNGNQAAAATVASSDAVSQMFAQAYQPIQTSNGPQDPYTFGSCDPAAGSVYCVWNAQGGAKITMTVRSLTGGLPIQVLQAQRQAA